MKKTSMGAAAAAVLCAVSAFVFSAQPLAAQEAQTEEPAAADGAAQSEQSETVTLTVDEAVEYAMEHSRTLKSAQIDLEMKRRAKQYTWNMFIPSVNANAAVSRSNQVTDSAAMLRNLGLPIPESDPTEGDHWMISGGVSVSLNLSLALIDGIKINTANYEAGLITWEQAVKQNELNIRKLFYALLLQQESLRIQEETLANAESRMIQARTNYRNGRVSELEYLQAQVTYENLKPQLLSAQQSLRQQLDMFAFVLGMPVGTQVALDGVIEPDYLELDVDAVVLGRHRHHLALAAGNHIDNLAGILLGQVDGEQLDGLALLPVDLLDDNLRLTYLQLVALATHGLDQDRQVQHATAIDRPGIVAVVGLAAVRAADRRRLWRRMVQKG